MKLHLPLLLLTSLVSSLAAHSTHAAEIPADYESIDLWIPDMLEDYRASDSAENCAFILWTDMEFTPETSPGWTSSTPLITGRNHIFTTAEGYDPMSLSFTGGSSKVFDQVTSLTFDTLSKLNISNQGINSAYGCIILNSAGKLVIHRVDDCQLDTADIVFSNNSAGSDGGSIYANEADAIIDISYNGGVQFSSNSVISEGGSIYSAGTVNICDNEFVTFNENFASASSRYSVSVYGGAICSTGTVNLCNNATVVFSENSADASSSSYEADSYGGVIYSEGAVTVSNNAAVFFTGNSACASSQAQRETTHSYGGAIYATEIVNICNNEDVSFIGNFASAEASGYASDAYAYGGAIYAMGRVNINNNANVLFCGNYAFSSYSSNQYTYAGGGAMYSKGAIVIEGNDCVIFEKNYEEEHGFFNLRSIYISPDSSSDSLVLAAKTGGSIIFHDSVYMWYYSGSQVQFNADYTDADGVTQKASGDIIFSGKYTAEHLAEVKGSAGTSSEISNSQTSSINNLITLYGGSLQVVDGAKLNGRGLTVAADSHATLLLRDGSMSHSSYNFTFNSTGTLELQGLNTITASKVTMGSGTSLVVTLSEANLTTAALTLGSTDLATSQLAVHLKRTDGLRSGMYKIISQSSSSDFTTKSAWTAANVTVTGSGNTSRASFEDLVWANGTLYYKVGRNIWANTSGDSLWNSTSDNWTMNGRSYTYLDGMDVSFTDAAAGTVKLEGDIAAADIIVNNTSGNDYIFTSAEGGGRLTGTGGLTKQGSGELTLDTANNYTGATKLKGGTLHVHHSTALGATADGGASVTTAAGTTLKVGNNSHLVLGGTYDMAGSVDVSAGSTLELQKDGRAADTLCGGGTVQVADSQVTVESLSSFTGNLELEGKEASLSIGSGSYAAAGMLSVAGGQLTFGSKANITLNAGGQLLLSALDGAAARLTANNINIRKGATLAADIQASVSPLGDTPVLSSREVGAELNCSILTLNMGAALDAEDAYFDLNNGTLVLAVTKTGTEKINLILAEHTVYTGSEQIVLFANAGKVTFIYNNITATSADGSTYTLNAADYFTGTGINESTQLVYDSTTGTLYLQGVEAIPEPATATLSLLALASLVIRRRRK